MYRCLGCLITFEEFGWTKTVDKEEFWGAKVPHEQYWDCCPECGSMNYEEVEQEEFDDIKNMTYEEYYQKYNKKLLL